MQYLKGVTISKPSFMGIHVSGVYTFSKVWMEVSCFLKCKTSNHNESLIVSVPSRSCRIITCHIFASLNVVYIIHLDFAPIRIAHFQTPKFLAPPANERTRFLPKPLGNPESLEGIIPWLGSVGSATMDHRKSSWTEGYSPFPKQDCVFLKN